MKISSILSLEVAPERKEKLQVLVDYIEGKSKAKQAIRLNFICTHNSRRSQMAQVWACWAANYYGIEIEAFSGGVEVTAFNIRAVEALKTFGLELIKQDESANPVYFLKLKNRKDPISLFSKHFDHKINPNASFAAVMTCSHADENCPLIPGVEIRISLPFEDPGHYDKTEMEEEAYLNSCKEIASEMVYVFGMIKQQL